MTKGRYREFYQCDFDIAREHNDMFSDAECLKIIAETLRKLEMKSFVIKVNHRSLLDGIFAACGVPQDKFRTLCSSIDKLDKSPWEDVRTEMVEDKLLDSAVADKIGRYISKGKKAIKLINELRDDQILMKQISAKQGLEEIESLFKYCDTFKLSEIIVFDLSLARGLDYYMGVIYEAVLTENNEVGSIAAGGRYDNLVSMFHPKKKNIPCVGFSLGVERIFSVLENRIANKSEKIRTTNFQAYVGSAQRNFHEERMRIWSDLMDAGINADQSYKENPRLIAELIHCDDNNIPLAIIIIGEDELAKGEVTLREVKKRKERSVSREKLVEEIKKWIADRS